MNSTEVLMLTHVVLYKTYGLNPKAAEDIVLNANRFLGILPMHTFFHCAIINPPERAVNTMDYDVMLVIGFASRSAFTRYMTHSSHMRFVRFVLRGWMIEGSDAANPGAEFIDRILYGQPGRLISRVRDPSVPDNEVVWQDERVWDAGR